MNEYPEKYPYRKLLDKGFVALVDRMGNDTRIVEAARVSYQQGTSKVQDDRNLIRYMLKNYHETPFEKVVFEFRVKCPMYIGEQWLRHRMGSFNKISGRYSEMIDEFYEPDPVRRQSKTNKQGSSDEPVNEIDVFDTVLGHSIGLDATDFFTQSHKSAYTNYEELINAGVSKEQARGVLPANLYTEFYWTVNLRSLFNFLCLRMDSHAQEEIRVYAEAIFQMLTDECGDLQYALEAFEDYRLDAPNITLFEMNILKELVFCSVAEGATPSSQQVFIKNKLITLINDNDSMSKREKKETKLFKLLGLEE